jgi:alpha-beta hydrolase superfamily lysophospholipase
MSESRRSERRAFLESVSLGALLTVLPGRLRAQTEPTGADVEALVGSVRWPGEGLRPRDFYNRYRLLNEWLGIGSVPDDIPGYLATWRKPRDRSVKRGQAYEKEGRRVSAGDAYLQAAAFSHREYVLHLRLGDAAEARRSYVHTRELFERGVGLVGPSISYERVSIPYGTGVLKGILVVPPGSKGQRLPVVYRTGGTDSTKESSFLGMIWAPFVDRGVACLMLDGPGQGEALNEQGLPLVPDWERAVKAAFDYLAMRPDVDARRLGLWGQSTGGYFGARGALPGTGAAAVVLQGACYDLLEDCYDFCPSFRKHLRFMMGATSDAQARGQLAAYNLRGLASRITVPISILHATRDNAVRFSGAQKLHAEIASKEKLFSAPDGARELGDSAPDAVADLIDWLCARLAA